MINKSGTFIELEKNVIYKINMSFYLHEQVQSAGIFYGLHLTQIQIFIYYT